VELEELEGVLVGSKFGVVGRYINESGYAYVMGMSP